MKKKYEISLNESQLSVINQSLELFYRLGMGQFDQIKHHPDYLGKNPPELNLLLDQLHIILTNLKAGEDYSIRSSLIDDKNRTAYDIHQAITEVLASPGTDKVLYSKQFAVDFNNPGLEILEVKTK